MDDRQIAYNGDLKLYARGEEGRGYVEFPTGLKSEVLIISALSKGLWTLIEEDLNKGESEGHPFRGNQYTRGYSKEWISVRVIPSTFPGAEDTNLYRIGGRLDQLKSLPEAALIIGVSGKHRGRVLLTDQYIGHAEMVYAYDKESDVDEWVRFFWNGESIDANADYSGVFIQDGSLKEYENVYDNVEFAEKKLREFGLPSDIKINLQDTVNWKFEKLLLKAAQLPKRVRLTQRRALITKAQDKAQKHVEDALRPVFKQQFRKLERFLRKGNLRKRLSKMDLNKGEAEGHPFRGNQYTDSSWRTPPQETLEREYHVEEELKHLGAFKSKEQFLQAVADAEVIEVTPELDKKISYRSRTSSKQQLIGLLRTYASWPQYRNEKTVNELYSRISSGEVMDMPLILEYPEGRMRIFSGNTRLDVAFQLGKIPKALLVKVPKALKKGEGLPFPDPEQIPLLFQSQGSPTENEDEWNKWKKALLIALLLGLFRATEDLAEIENQVWTSRGQDSLTYDAEMLILAYQLRTGYPLENIALTTLIAVERIITEWYTTDEAFPLLMSRLERYFNDTRIQTIAKTEVGNLLAQMVIQQMTSYGLTNWYWDAMGEDPCKTEIFIGGVTYEGCKDLNGRRFKLGDPMPPHAAHPNCQCLPTIQENLRVPVDRKATFGDQHPKPPKDGPLTPLRTQRFLGKLRKHLGPGDHPSGSSQDVHNPNFQGSGLMKEKAQLRHILKFRGKNGEKVNIDKIGNHWQVQISDAEGVPLSKAYSAYSKAQLIKSGNLAVQDIEAEIWKVKEPEEEPKKKGIKARLRAILKFEHENQKILFERVGGKYQVAVISGEDKKASQVFNKREEAVDYAESLMKSVKAGITPDSQAAIHFEGMKISAYESWADSTKKHLDAGSKDAIKAYGDGKYTEINEHHRFNKYSSDEQVKKWTKDLDKAIVAHPPKDLLVWRSVSANEGTEWHNFWKSVSVGSTLVDKGYGSTSVSESFATNWGSGGNIKVLMKIEVPKSSKILPLGTLSGHSAEYEVLFPRNSQFKITQMKWVNKRLYVTMRHLP